jgi:hypothetical protein
MDNMERIICAAIHYDMDGEYFHQPKNIDHGFVVCGRRHSNCLSTVAALLPEGKLKITRCTSTQGFITTKDRFVNRQEARDIAVKCGITPDHSTDLFSEDLY